MRLAPFVSTALWLAIGLRLLGPQALESRDFLIAVGLQFVAISLPFMLAVREVSIGPDGLTSRYFTGRRRKLAWDDLKLAGHFRVRELLVRDQIVRLVPKRGRTITLRGSMVGFEDFVAELSNHVELTLQPRYRDFIFWKAQRL